MRENSGVKIQSNRNTDIAELKKNWFVFFLLPKTKIFQLENKFYLVIEFDCISNRKMYSIYIEMFVLKLGVSIFVINFDFEISIYKFKFRFRISDLEISISIEKCCSTNPDFDRKISPEKTKCRSLPNQLRETKSKTYCFPFN